VSTPEYLDPADVAGLVLPSDRYQVVAVSQDSDLLGDDLIDVLDISYTVTGRPGVFSQQIPLVGFAVFEYGIDLTSEAAIVEAIYGLAV
jgi:hypothetical protein